MPSKPVPVHPPLGTLIDGGALELVEVLGVGGYGVVYRAVDTRSRPPISYAVKSLAHSSTAAHRQRILHIREIALHQLASAHPGVVTLHRVVEGYNHTFLVMDYASDGDLFSQILNNCRYLGEDRLIKHVFLQLIDAVEYCHSLGIYHRDLKPENVLCYDNGLRVAITDFGLATTERVSEEFRTGSVYHMSPECQGGEFAPNGTYSPMANDIWSLAIVLLNLATGRNPWKSASPDDLTFQAYLRNPRGFLPTVLPISSEVNAILVRMLEVDWRHRMNLKELREAIEDVTTFYSEDAVFEGSMARCPWESMEVDVDLEESEESTKGGSPVDKVMEESADVKSRWSDYDLDDSTSEIVFATPKSADEDEDQAMSPQWREYSSRSSSTSSSGSENMSVYYDRSDTPGFTRSQFSPSPRSSSNPSLPTTPGDTELTFGGRCNPVKNPKSLLTITTDLCAPLYYNNTNDSVGSFSSGCSSMMQTALEDTAYSSSFFLASPASKDVPPVKGPRDDDKEMASPSSGWATSPTDISFPSIHTSTRSSLVDISPSYQAKTSSISSSEVLVWPEMRHTRPILVHRRRMNVDHSPLSSTISPPHHDDNIPKGSNLFNSIKFFPRSLVDSPESSSYPPPHSHLSPSPPPFQWPVFSQPASSPPKSTPLETPIPKNSRPFARTAPRRHWFSPGKLFAAS